MGTIRLTTWIDAPVERCFKLATNVDLAVAAGLRDHAIGRAPGDSITEGETIKWQGRHFGRVQIGRIDGWRPFSYFRDVIVEGPFVRFEHEHHFALMDDGTRMRDEIRFIAPYGVLGRVTEKLLRRRLVKLLKQRNARIKRVAESEEWRKYLEESTQTAKMSRAREEELARGWNGSALLRG